MKMMQDMTYVLFHEYNIFLITVSFLFSFVLDNGELYVWGSGSEGQLGLGISECELPTLLKFRSKVTLVDCGYYHTAVITGNYPFLFD